MSHQITVWPASAVRSSLPPDAKLTDVTAALCFGLWLLFSRRLRYWSLQQDQTGATHPTHRMRVYSGIGIFVFALTLTMAAVMWMKGLQHQWFSTMYGVYYFAGSVWLTLATA